MTGISGLPSAKRAAHDAAVTRLRDAYAAVPAGVPVRLAKPTSNLFRYARDTAKPGQPGGERAVLDVSAFSRVIHVDPAARTAVVGGMTTYEALCDATLPHQLMPLVVPQLKTITLGGAVTGLGIESSSLWNGLPHESVHGDGDPHRRRPGGRRHQGQRAQRPLLRLSQLLRDPRLLARPDDRADAGQAVRAPAARQVHRPARLHGRHRADRGERRIRGAQGGLPRRCRLQHRPSCT